MPGPGTDPTPGGTYFFTLTLGGAEAAGFFRECSGFSSENDVVEHQWADKQGKANVTKLPGQNKWSNITLKRGVDKDSALWKWRKDIIDGKIDSSRKDGTITIVDWEGKPVVTYKFVRGWPSKYTSPGLNASANEILLEEIEIVHEGFERT
jgi:phage tail-like protein